MANPSDALDAARALLAKERHGVLSTLHAKHDGWPFGSVTPYAVTPSGDPVVLLSDIAEHTRNLLADPRASLLVLDSDTLDRPQEGARLTLMVRAEIASGPDLATASAAYFGRFPEARANLAVHGFALRLRVERVRWIAGFGQMGWFARDAWIDVPKEADPLAPHAPAIVAHMNTDHADALQTLARHHAAGAKGHAVMTGVDSRGMDLEIRGPVDAAPRRLRIAFPAPAPVPEAARKAVSALLAEARKA